MSPKPPALRTERMVLHAAGSDDRAARRPTRPPSPRRAVLHHAHRHRAGRPPARSSALCDQRSAPARQFAISHWPASASWIGRRQRPIVAPPRRRGGAVSLDGQGGDQAGSLVAPRTATSRRPSRPARARSTRPRAPARLRSIDRLRPDRPRSRRPGPADPDAPGADPHERGRRRRRRARASSRPRRVDEHDRVRAAQRSDRATRPQATHLIWIRSERPVAGGLVREVGLAPAPVLERAQRWRPRLRDCHRPPRGATGVRAAGPGRPPPARATALLLRPSPRPAHRDTPHATSAAAARTCRRDRQRRRCIAPGWSPPLLTTPEPYLRGGPKTERARAPVPGYAPSFTLGRRTESYFFSSSFFISSMPPAAGSSSLGC